MNQTEFDYAMLWSCPMCGMPTSDKQGTPCGRFPECAQPLQRIATAPARTRGRSMRLREVAGGIALLAFIGLGIIVVGCGIAARRVSGWFKRRSGW